MPFEKGNKIGNRWSKENPARKPVRVPAIVQGMRDTGMRTDEIRATMINSLTLKVKELDELLSSDDTPVFVVILLKRLKIALEAGDFKGLEPIMRYIFPREAPTVNVQNNIGQMPEGPIEIQILEVQRMGVGLETPGMDEMIRLLNARPTVEYVEAADSDTPPAAG